MKKMIEYSFIVLLFITSCSPKSEIDSGFIIEDDLDLSPRIVPEISSVLAPSNGHYISSGNANIDFQITFSEAVTVTGTPRIELKIGYHTRYAEYFSGSTSNTLTFRYTVLAADMDFNGVSHTNSIDLNGGSIEGSELTLESYSFSALDLSLVFVINPSLVSWYDANDPSTVNDVENDNPGDAGFDNIVATWSDKSSHGFDVTQGEATREPAYIPNAINTNLAVLRFDGLNDYLSSTAFTHGTNDATRFFVAKRNGAHGGSYSNIVLTGANSFTQPVNFFQCYATAGHALLMNLSINTLDITPAPSVQFSTAYFQLFTQLKNNAAGTEFFIDGTSKGASGNSAQTLGSQLYIGSWNNNDTNMDFPELIAFNTPLSQADRQWVEGYLAHKYALTGNLPVAHPYKSNAP